MNTAPVWDVELTTDASSSFARLAFQYETAAEREERRRGLLAEANAFRRIAKMIDTGPWPGPWTSSAELRAKGIISPALRSRLVGRVEAANPEARGADYREWVLLCLWLALECESEARALRGAP